MLKAGDKLLIAHRRLFETDQPRYFVGTVLAYEAGLVKLSGYSWVREHIRGDLERKDDRRVKVIALNSGAAISYQLPETVDLDALKLEARKAMTVVLTDGAGFLMDLTEHVLRPSH